MTHRYVVRRHARERGAAQGGRWRRRRPANVAVVASLLALGVTAALAGSPAVASQSRHDGHDGHDGHHSRAFTQTNLVSDLEGMAELTDPALKNPWGLAFGPTTPAWVNNQFNPASACPEDEPDCLPAPEDLLTKITLYSGANGQTPIAKVPLEVTGSSPTGIVFNPTASFLIDQGAGPTPARFLFNEAFIDAAGTAPEARITGWSPSNPPVLTTTSTTARKDEALHFGLALVPETSHRGPLLLAADGINGTIDVFDSTFAPVSDGALFVDPKAAKQGLAPYNVTVLDGRVYVAYAGETRGAVSVFKASGRFRERLITSRRLVGPWGMAIAPDHWGRFGDDLLVGNVDDGMINAFDRHDGDFRGTLRDVNGDPLVNIGLWGIEFGNGTIGTPSTLLFVAGVGEEVGGFGDEVYEHGLMGAITPASRHHDDD